MRASMLLLEFSLNSFIDYTDIDLKLIIHRKHLTISFFCFFVFPILIIYYIKVDRTCIGISGAM